jgi:hypothetical protein
MASDPKAGTPAPATTTPTTGTTQPMASQAVAATVDPKAAVILPVATYSEDFKTRTIQTGGKTEKK